MLFGGDEARLSELLSHGGDKALPLMLPRANLSSDFINQQAERVARQMAGEHVVSGKPKETFNLAGRSKKESQRVKGLNYKLSPTGTVAQEVPYTPRRGDLKVAVPGDQTVSNKILDEVNGVPIDSVQEGGAYYGLGQRHLDDPEFWKSNEEPAKRMQSKVDRVAELYEPNRVIGSHLAMGPMSNNFAMHFADANLRAIDWSKAQPNKIDIFDSIIAYGYKDPKTKEMVKFPNWPGLADREGALTAMKEDANLRKWFNNRMKTPKVTKPLGLPNGLDIQYAITEPRLRDMEINMTGLMTGELQPGALVEAAGAPHNTYSHRILGKAGGPQEVLTPFVIDFPDAAQHIASTKKPADFTGTIQKVFPHQLVDDQYLNQYGEYRDRIKELTGQKEGGAVDMEAADARLAQAIQARMAKGGAVDMEAADARLQAAIQARMGGEKVAHMAGGGGKLKALGDIAKKFLVEPETAQKIIQAPSIIIPSKISNVKEAVRQSKGEYGAKRVERAADEIPNLEKLYKEEALKQAFQGDNAKPLMTINPADFEKYAMGLPTRTVTEPRSFGDKTRMSTEDYLKYLRTLPEGFDDVPFLEINKQEQGLPLMPFISAHEGRHRNRAMAEGGEKAGLVRLFPRQELREGFPRRSQEEYIEALKKELEMTGNLVLPEHNRYNPTDVQRPAIELPDIYAKGGGVHMAGAGGVFKALGDIGKKFLADAPQTEALKLAQQRAALPPAKGGLGLPADNTPMNKVLPLAERDANLQKFLAPSAEKRRMYHGSKNPNIKAFKTRKEMTNEDNMTGHYADERDAVFLSPEPDFTKNFSIHGYTDTNQAPTTYPVYVQVERPFDFDNPEHLKQVKETYLDMYHNPESEFYDPHLLASERSTEQHLFNKKVDSLMDDENNWGKIENEKFQDVLKDIGFDSFYTRERGTKNLGVYEPNRIKSAISNRGTYDLGESDMSKAKGGLMMAGGGIPHMADAGRVFGVAGKFFKKLLADDVVNGIKVRKDIPNQSSIGASLNDYSIHGVQEVPMSAFQTVGKPKYRNAQEEKRTKELARQIQENKELNPLIVVKDAEGHYILEGGHRFDALRELDIDSFPALMVHDLESLADVAIPAVAKAHGGALKKLQFMDDGGIASPEENITSDQKPNRFSRVASEMYDEAKQSLAKDYERLKSSAVARAQLAKIAAAQLAGGSLDFASMATPFINSDALLSAFPMARAAKVGLTGSPSTGRRTSVLSDEKTPYSLADYTNDINGNPRGGSEDIIKRAQKAGLMYGGTRMMYDAQEPDPSKEMLTMTPKEYEKLLNSEGRNRIDFGEQITTGRFSPVTEIGTAILGGNLGSKLARGAVNTGQKFKKGFDKGHARAMARNAPPFLRELEYAPSKKRGGLTQLKAR